MELWDVYDENRVKTGRLHERGKKMADGDYHLVVHVWIKNSAGMYLCSKRSPNKPWPGFWECTAGSALAGENSLEAALREAHEELGVTLDSECGKLLLSFKLDDFFNDVWLFRREVELSDITLQEDETCDAKWVTSDEILRMREHGEFVPFQDYFDKLFGDVAHGK